jgi:hypothetical protein
MVVLGEGEMQRDRLGAGADFEFTLVAGQQ